MNTAAANATAFYLLHPSVDKSFYMYDIQFAKLLLLKAWSMTSGIDISWKLLERQNPRLHLKTTEPDTAF